MRHLGNRFIGLSISGTYPVAVTLTDTLAWNSASSRLRFSPVQAWLACKSPLLRGIPANGNLRPPPGSPSPYVSIRFPSVCMKKRFNLYSLRPQCRVSDRFLTGSMVGMHPRCVNDEASAGMKERSDGKKQQEDADHTSGKGVGLPHSPVRSRHVNAIGKEGGQGNGRR